MLAHPVLIYLYLATLLFGSVLLGASILLGGHDDLDVDGDVDLDVDADADFDADVGAGDVDGGMDKDLDFAGADVFFWPLRSVRFWTFFTAFFGLTGLAVSSLGLLGPIPGLITALSMGIGSGWFASWVIRKLASDESGRAGESGDFIGKSARVVVPVKPGGVGKVRVEIRGQQVDVLAITDDDRAITSEDEVLVIEMEGTRARVARLTKD